MRSNLKLHDILRKMNGNSKKKNKKKAIIVAFDSGAARNFKMNSYLAEISSKDYEDMIVIGCDGTLKTCLPKRTSYDSQKICDICVMKQNSLSKKYNLELFSIRNESINIETYRNALDMNRWDLKTLNDWNYFGENLLNLIAWQYLIDSKKTTLNAENEKEKVLVLDLLRDVLNLNEFLNSNAKLFIERDVYMIDGNYVHHRIIYNFCKSLEIGSPKILVMSPLNRNGLIKYQIVNNTYRIDNFWENIGIRSVPTKIRFFQTLTTINSLYKTFYFGSDRTFSAKNLNEFSKFFIEKISNFKEKEVFFTSSTDEMAASLYYLGRNTQELVNEQRRQILMFAQRAQKYPNKAFILRFHPRNNNKNSMKIDSQDWLDLKHEIEKLDLMKNFFVVDSNVSISAYKLISLCNKVYTSWSTVGIEAVALGVPVIQTQEDLSLWKINHLNEVNNGTQKINDYLFLEWINRYLVFPWKKALVTYSSDISTYDIRNSLLNIMIRYRWVRTMLYKITLNLNKFKLPSSILLNSLYNKITIAVLLIYLRVKRWFYFKKEN